MNGRVVLAILLALVLVVGIAGIGSMVYNAGVVRGISQAGPVAAPQQGVVPYPYYGPFFHPFGYGLFGFLIPLFFLLLVFGLLRRAFWRRHWNGHDSPWGQDVPPRFREWHRRLHEQDDEPRTS